MLITQYTVKKTKKIYFDALPTKNVLELIHIPHTGLILWSLRVSATGLLIFTECRPCKKNHLLVTLREKANRLNHFGQEAGGLGPSRKFENVDVVTGGEIAHDELVYSYDMLPE